MLEQSHWFKPYIDFKTKKEKLFAIFLKNISSS